MSDTHLSADVSRGDLRRRAREMPKCEICYEDVDKVYMCKTCGTEFCVDCGDPKKKICILCIEEEEEEEDEEVEEKPKKRK